MDCLSRKYPDSTAHAANLLCLRIYAEVQSVSSQAVSYAEQNKTEYQPGQYMSVLERGAATVVCNVGTPKANGKVYVRVKANTSIANGVVGGFEAAADSTNTIEIPNMRWTSGAMDANRVCEVTLLTRASE